jgi:hypothetical protein
MSNTYIHGDIHLSNNNKNDKIDVFIDSDQNDVKFHTNVESIENFISIEPTQNNHCATKLYVDNTVGSNSSDTQVIFNDVGVLTGDSEFTYNKVSKELSMGDNKIIDVATPTNNTDATNKLYVDSIASLGVTWKNSVCIATTGPLTLASDFENGDTIDGTVLATNDRILIKDQASGIENGIYTVNASGAPTRSVDTPSGLSVAGLAVWVNKGNVNGDQGWVCISDPPNDIVGTDSLSFSLFASIPATGVHNLQVTTDVGNTTTNAIDVTNTTQSTSVSTGAIICDGGVGVAKNLYVGNKFNLDDYQFPDGHFIGDQMSTGLLSGGQLSVASGTQFSITDGDGIITDSTIPSTPVTYEVTWTGLSNITVSNLPNKFTYVYIDNAGSVVQSIVEPTPTLRRDNIFLGKLFHADGATLTSVNDQPDSLDNANSQFHDFTRGIGPVVLTGLRITANGTNLSIDRTPGSLHQTGIYFHTSVQSPNIKDYTVSTLSSFARSTQLAIGSSFTTLDPGNYDLAGVVTIVPGSGSRATNMRVYFFNSGFISIQYGQTWYTNLAEAQQNVASESFVVEPFSVTNGILLAIISIRKDATDLTDPTQASIFNASRFGEVSIGVGGTATANFQNVYDNSGQPQIIVDATGGALQIQDAAITIGGNLFEIKDTVGSNLFDVDNAGNTKAYGNIDLDSTNNVQFNTTDLVISHSGIAGSITNTTGDLTIENSAITSDTIVKLGSTTNNTKFIVENSLNSDIFEVQGSGVCKFLKDAPVLYGAGGDFTIFHDRTYKCNR